MPAAIEGFPLIYPLVAVSLGMCAESATSTPFDGDKVLLRGSRQPFLGATSPSPLSFFSLDTCVFSSTDDCDDCDVDGSPGSEFPMCTLGTECIDCAPPPPAPHSPAMVCMNNCLIADSSCSDDGGDPGSEFAKCAYIIDCGGVRPMLPPLTSSPPVSPPEPTLPPGICTNTSFSASNADFDDGSPGSEFPMCTLSTECVDCGVHTASPPPPAPHSPAMVCMNNCLIAGGSLCGDPGFKFAKYAYVTDCISGGPRVSMPSPPARSPAVHAAPNPPLNICSNSCFSTSNIACSDMVSCPYLSTTVDGTGLHRNLAGNSFLDLCAICRGAAWTCAGRNSMTADDGLRKGARQVSEIALAELFIESKLWNADVKYSFPYDDTAGGDPVEEEATTNGVPLQWVECVDGALVLLSLGLLVYAVCSEQERSGRNTRFVIWSKSNRSYRNEWVKLALLALIVPGVSALAMTAPPDGDGTRAHPDRHAHWAESAQTPPLRPPPPTQLCADDVISGALDASGAPLPCSYFEAQPSACASYSLARTNCPVACGTCPPDPPGVVVSTGAETSHRALAVGMHAVQLNHRRAQQAQAGVAPSLTSAPSTSAGSSPVAAPPFPRSPLPPSPASPTPWSLPLSSPSTPLPSPTRPPPRLSPPLSVLPPTLSLYSPDSGPPPWSSAPPPPMPLLPIPTPPHLRMPSQPPPSSPLLPPSPLLCTVLPCTKANDIPGLNSVQLVPSHRRELQTAVSTSVGLLSALANTGVGRIVLAPGTYVLNAELSITRSVVLEAAVAGSVVLDAQASSSSRRRVLYINPGSLGVVQLIGLNITGGNVQNVRAPETSKLPIALVGCLADTPDSTPVNRDDECCLNLPVGSTCHMRLKLSWFPSPLLECLADMPYSTLVFDDGCCLDLPEWSTCHLLLKLQNFHRIDGEMADVLALTHACTTAADASVNYSMYVLQRP
jgi:hypothetical protein